MDEWRLVCLVLLAAAFYQAGIIRVEKRSPAAGTVCASPLSRGRKFRRGLIKKGH